MAPPSSSSRLSSASSALTWRPTKIMHMRDLSKDDDFLSHLLVEKLGTGTVPLLVHKMDSSRRLPKTDSQDLMRIVRRLVSSKGPITQSIRQAVDELLELPPIRYYLKSYTQKQINAFATHASRYFELYNPAGSIEIAHTSRYSHHTGKSELCILATRNLAVGSVVTELKGSMANLTDEEDKELKRTDLRNCDIRRDFSVIHSKSMKKNHLFLGPARFVNHDCDNNCELFREGKYITFRVLRPIAIGEEITAHYGDGYFGKKNRHCLCETCEKNGRGGYSPEHQNEEPESSSDSSSGSDSDSDSDSETSSSDAESDVPEKPLLNVNERRTRRGVYAITKPKEDSSDDSDNEEDEDKVPLADASGVPADDEIELIADREVDAGSDLTSMPPSDGSSPAKRSTPDLMTPDRNVAASRSSSSLTELTSTTGRSTPKSNQSTPFRSIISTRRQRAAARESQELGSASTGKRKASQTEDTSSSRSVEPSPKRLTRSVSSLMLSEKKGKGKGKATPTPVSTPRSGKAAINGKQRDEIKVKKEDLVDARVLRTRLSLATPEVPKETPKPDVPRGPDGKPLPTCSTCSNVLPLIAVDSKVVWGLGAEASTKKRKNVKHDCPRCLRHFAIYQCPWPSRIAPRGTISETPREETPVEVITKKVTHKGLSILDRKLAAAASASASSAKSGKSKKRGRVEEVEEEEEEEQPRAKRRKSEPEPVLHKAKVTKTYQSKKHKRALSPEPVEEEAPETSNGRRKRGRPRLSSPKAVDPNVKLEDPAPDAERSLLSQPRSFNGRFGRKEKARKAAELAALQKAHAEGREPDSEDGDIRRSSRYKRSNEILEELEESPRKRATMKASVQSDEGIQKVMPRPVSGFRGGRLFSNPNPLQYALHAWAGPLVLDDSSSDDEKHPETPDDADSLAAGIVTPEDEGSAYATPAVMIPRGPLTFKPSPFAYAKSRWNGRGPLSSTKKFSITENKKIYLTDEEDPLHTERDVSPRADDYPSPLSSDEGAVPHKLRLVYPVLHPAAATNSFMPKSTTFSSQNSETTPSFIHAGWDDTSDASEA
ncbi:hypothetical protein BDN70DRAFT_876184 [Pholiota conissans]|uniref:SET domain-containing protein n=1 Tax=Pholiota conissans TaxID=109636 RepID=A0A9P6CVB7_9AGAR|nr:hypothetical protein BDN70DRAFT_876184 [Pholiota conissans]